MRTKCTFFIEKLTMLLLLVVLLPGLARAQITAGSYGFAQSSGTYTPITGGTVIATGIPDYQAYPSIALTPGFNFCGIVYTNAFVTADGLITLGGTTAANTTNGIADGGGSNILLCPFNSDMVGSSASGATPNIRYELVGNEHVFQWNDISRWPSATDRFSFQARLNHVTGTITYVYSVTSVGTSLNYQPIIGIRTATTAGNWQSRTVGTGAETWATSLPGTTTTSNVRFTNSSPAKFPVTGQTYVYSPPPNCSTTVAPVVSAATANPTAICVTGIVNLGISASMPAATGFTYQWQRAAVAAGPFTTIANTTTNTYAAPINATSFYRCRVLCNNDSASPYWVSTASPQVIVNNPGTPVPTGGTRCGPGTVTLTSTAPAGTTLNWYQNATGGLPLGTGSPFTTPSIPTTTTFYVSAASGTSPAQQWVGTGTLNNSFQPNPYYTGWWGNKNQYLIRASELIAAGLSAGIINNIGFDVLATNGLPMTNLAVAMKSTTINTLTTWETGLTPVFSAASFTPTANSVNVHTFTTGFPWDGVSNIIIETCFNNSSWSGAHTVKYTDNLGFNASLYYYNDVSTVCTAPGTPTTMTSRPNIRFGMTVSCQGPRVPVVATVTPGPTFTKSNPAIVCNGAIDSFVVTSPLSNYGTYAWTPATDLYTNAAATISYVPGASANKVYFKSTTVGARTIAVFANNTTTPFCAAADTVRLWVQPGDVTIKAIPDTICVTGTASLALVPNTGYAPNSIQWQQSTNGTGYIDIAGATSANFTTPTLSSPTPFMFYRALIKSNTTTPCLSPVKKIVIADPQLISTQDSFHCGPGVVTLEAATDGVSSVKWYSSLTATQPIGSGSPFETPFLGTTTSYYAAASTGTPQPAPTFVTTGTSSGGFTDLPLFTGYWLGTKTQYIIPATAMTTAGFVAGLITSIGYDILSAGSAVQDMTIGLKNTTTTLFPTTFPSAFEAGAQPVYTTASFQPVANQVNVLNLQTPFYWDGTSNILVEECHRNTSYGTASVLRYTYLTYGNGVYCNSDVANFCAAPPPATTYATGALPKMWIGMRGPCESNRVEVTAHIYPKPAVDLGQDINKCVDEGSIVVLDAGVQPNIPQFHWDDNTTSQVRAVDESGDYNVVVTNSYGCEGSDTITVVLRDNPVVELGNDTTVCNGVVLDIDAGSDGIEYFWNTGSTAQHINVNTGGTYNVFVTNADACIKTDTIVITMQGELPTIQGINISNNGQYTFHFTAVNPQNVIGYDWDFGDSSTHSYAAAPYHTYADGGNYVVVLRLSSTCGFMDDTTSAHIVGIHQINVDNSELTVYPNPTRDQATILNKGAMKMEKIEVYNILGQVVYSNTADSKDKHTLKLNGLASGVYTIQIFTDKGNVARKLEILK